MPQARLKYEQGATTVDWTADAAYSAGDVIQLRDGRAAVVTVDVASGNTVAVYVTGIFVVTKTATMVLLPGGCLYWDHSADAAHFAMRGDRDFFLGSNVADAASADTTCDVDLNVRPVYAASLEHGYQSVTVLTADLINDVLPSGREGVQHTFGAVAEAGKNDALSVRSFSNVSLPIVEARLTVVDGGDNAALDYNIGVASGTHATDADSIAASCFLHINGTDTKLYAESDDNATEVAATDTTLTYTAGTPFEVWFDLRNPADVQIYINGVLVLPNSTFVLSGVGAATLKLLSHMEKTSDNTTAHVVVHFLRARLAQV